MTSTSCVVDAVRAVEALRRIKRPLKDPGQTFFSEWDVWIFQASFSSDPMPCLTCRTAEDIEQFRGNNLRMNFPYLEIQDENTIKANVHPNCRCYLVRLLD